MLTGKKTVNTVNSNFYHLLRKQKVMQVKHIHFANIIQLTSPEQKTRTFCLNSLQWFPRWIQLKLMCVPGVYWVWFPPLPVLMNSSEASPSVAESFREDVGGVKEGVTLYKYQFHSNRLSHGPTVFVRWILRIICGLVWQENPQTNRQTKKVLLLSFF